MTREEYIIKKNNNDIYSIIYHYFIENSNNPLPELVFYRYLNDWLDYLFAMSLQAMNPISKNQLLNDITSHCMQHYDYKFNITILIYDNKTLMVF